MYARSTRGGLIKLHNFLRDRTVLLSPKLYNMYYSGWLLLFEDGAVFGRVGSRHLLAISPSKEVLQSSVNLLIAFILDLASWRIEFTIVLSIMTFCRSGMRELSAFRLSS